MSGGWIYNDGGRADAGYKGKAGDCVCRAIAIATGKPYKEVYDDLGVLAKAQKVTARTPSKKVSARDGVYRATYQKYLESLGWKWVPTMRVGQGCTVHLNAKELPQGSIIIRISKHMTAMIDGVIHDTYDPRRTSVFFEDGVKRIADRCVYGYFMREEATTWANL